MPVRQCPKGLHYFNPDIHAACPICAQDDKAESSFGADRLRTKKSVPSERETMLWPEAGPDSPPAEATPPGAERAGTTYYFPHGANQELNAALGEGPLPVVGWLVVIAGPGLGRDFRLIPGQNRLGRDRRMEVCLDFGENSDRGVSRERHALVVYDAVANECFISEQTESRNLPVLNGQSVRTATTLKAGDIIQVGVTRLLFVPLCGPLFRWEAGGYSAV